MTRAEFGTGDRSAVDRSGAFDRIARTYDALRPGYPESLYECIARYGQLRPTARVLEIGAGTGKATVAFARRGFSLLALEPGESLAAIAREHLEPFDRVQVECVRFEDWSVESTAAQAFDLACSAQAFHWLDPSTRLPKLARALKPGGTLAIFGHTLTVSSSAIGRAIEAAYQQHAPALLHRDEQSWYGAANSPVVADLRDSEQFADILFETFPWQRARRAKLLRSAIDLFRPLTVACRAAVHLARGDQGGDRSTRRTDGARLLHRAFPGPAGLMASSRAPCSLSASTVCSSMRRGFGGPLAPSPFGSWCQRAVRLESVQGKRT